VYHQCGHWRASSTHDFSGCTSRSTTGGTLHIWRVASLCGIRSACVLESPDQVRPRLTLGFLVFARFKAHRGLQKVNVVGNPWSIAILVVRRLHIGRQVIACTYVSEISRNRIRIRGSVPFSTIFCCFLLLDRINRIMLYFELLNWTSTIHSKHRRISLHRD
jgi:hypothetical protein